MFDCPRTRRAIDAGIQTDKKTLAAASAATVALYCPHCRSTHELPLRCGRLSEACAAKVSGEPEPPKAPALAIAINALRISWLRRGLSGRKAEISG
jgi:hypothetical protein